LPNKRHTTKDKIHIILVFFIHFPFLES
jgi:hypothetical protein